MDNKNEANKNFHKNLHKPKKLPNFASQNKTVP